MIFPTYVLVLCHIISYLLTVLAHTIPGDIGTFLFVYRPHYMTLGQYYPVWPLCSVSNRLKVMENFEVPVNIVFTFLSKVEHLFRFSVTSCSY